jgi:hypothetical protein
MNQVELKILDKNIIVPSTDASVVYNTIKENLYVNGKQKYQVYTIVFAGRKNEFTITEIQNLLDNHCLIFNVLTYEIFNTNDMVEFLKNHHFAEYIRKIDDLKPIATLASSTGCAFIQNYKNNQELRDNIPIVEFLFSEWMNENILPQTNSKITFNIKIYSANSDSTQFIFYDESRLNLLAQVLEIEPIQILTNCTTWGDKSTFDMFVIYMGFGDLFGKSPCPIDITEYCKKNPQFEDKIAIYQSMYN